MLPDNFDFAQLPEGKGPFTLREIGMLSSNLEDIDHAITSWIKDDLLITTLTNEGNISVPVLWQTPERSYQIKNERELRDAGDAAYFFT